MPVGSGGSGLGLELKTSDARGKRTADPVAGGCWGGGLVLAAGVTHCQRSALSITGQGRGHSLVL